MRKDTKGPVEILAKRTSMERWLATASPYRSWTLEKNRKKESDADTSVGKAMRNMRTGMQLAPTDLHTLPRGSSTPNPVASYIARLAPGSRPAQATACETLARIVSGNRHGAADLAWHRLAYQQTAAVRAELVSRYQPATVNRHLSALRGVLREAWRQGLIPEEQYRKAIDVSSVREQKPPVGRAVPAQELSAIFACVAADTSLRGVRDRALLAVLCAGGLRRQELVRLTREDCRDLPELRVRGKGNKERVVVLPAWAGECLRVFASQGEVGKEAIFTRFTRDGDLTAHRLGVRAVAKILARRTREAGVPPCAPHDLRRTYCTALLERGADPLTVARLMGHADVRTTQRYDRRGVDALRKAADLLVKP